MRRAAFIAIFLLLPAGLGLPASAQTAGDDTDLQAATRQLAKSISDPFEQIHLLSTPLYVDWPARTGRPQRRGALVLFSLEGRYGGNSYFFYVAHFERRMFEEIDRDGSKREWASHYLTDFVQVGEKFWRMLAWDQARATPEGIVLPTQVWLHGDAGCCPTGKASIRLDVDRRGRLTVTDLPLQ